MSLRSQDPRKCHSVTLPLLIIIIVIQTSNAFAGRSQMPWVVERSFEGNQWKQFLTRKIPLCSPACPVLRSRSVDLNCSATAHFGRCTFMPASCRIQAIAAFCLQALQRQRQESSLKCSTHGDRVFSFDEAAAAGGCLGRFPGSEVLPLIRQIAAC